LAVGTGQVQVGTNLIAINWATGNKYQQVEFDSNGGNSFTNMGTTELLSVPYALYAAKSGNTTDFAVYLETASNGIAPSTTLLLILIG
jgi:hypothetical protein